VRLVSGTAERDGTELALNVTYKFRGIKSKILTWRGCEIDIEPSGDFDEYVAEYVSPDETPQVSYLNLHFLLDGLRREARAKNATGPRVLVAGARDVGKTSLARTLAALAVKSGAQPVVANMDPREGMLSLPGTLTAAVYATIMDLDGEGTNGWGGTPTSGPSGVPVKLPIAQYYGRQNATDDIQLYKEIVSKLAGAATARMSSDVDVKSSGMIIDTPGINFSGQIEAGALDILTHVVDEFSVNIIVVLGSPQIHAELRKHFATEKTTLGEPVALVMLDKSHGVVERDEGWMKAMQEAAIKEYFFGDSKRTLSPFTQQVDLDSVAIYRIPERKS
jgi:polyribonucleotide 5'-hydroxyl-kinase